MVVSLGASVGVTAFPRWAMGAEDIVPQPFFASVMRAVAALAEAGQPLVKADANRLAALAARADGEAVKTAEAILDRYTLARVVLDKDGMGQATLGGADRKLIEQGWRSFLIRVSNPHGLTDKFDASAGGGAGQMSQSNLEQKAGLPDTLFKAPMI